MDRSALISMLGALPDTALLKAFSVVGLQPMGNGSGATSGGGQMGDLMAADPSSHIEGWKERKVAYGGGADRPPISDKTWAGMKAKPDQMMAKGGGLGVADHNPFLQTGGM